MDLDEARRLADIVASADSGCDVCVRGLVDKLNRHFPAFTWVRHDGVTPWIGVEYEDFDTEDEYYDALFRGVVTVERRA